ncbi:hypothetical protein [Mucilaginibacter defluvii]
MLNDEAKVREKLKEPYGAYYYIPSLEGSNIVFALYEIYVNQSFQASKQFFYRAALIPEFMLTKFDQSLLMYRISYALLSDNAKLISRYSILRNKVEGEINIGYQLPNAVQNILLEDWGKLDWNIHCIGRLVKHPKLIHLEGYHDAFVGFRNDDQTLIEQGLKKLIDKPKKLDDNQLFPRFFSRDAAGLNKLAWMRGIEIDLKSSLVPVELMPVQPLEKYEGYDFLDELWDKPLSVPER